MLLGIKYDGKANVSSGCSIASIGLPAVILPSNGTSTTKSSFLIANSFSTNNSKALFLEPSFLIYPFCSRLDKWACIVAGDEISSAAPISLTVGG